MRKYSAVLFLLLSAGIIYAQSTGPAFIIEEVHFITDKYTRESALERKTDIQIGKKFASIEELEEYLGDKAQHLRNLRVLEEVEYSYELTEDPAGEETGVSVIYEITGSWTIYPIVYPKYDSNTGFRIGSQIYYDNFFGTLTKFYLGGNIDVEFSEDGAEISQWSVNPRISGLSIGQFNFDAEIYHKYRQIKKFNSDNEVYEEDYSMHSTSLEFDTSIQLPWDLKYKFGPNIRWYYGYKDNLPDNGSNIEEKDLKFSWGHSIGLSNLNWYGNFRQGTSFSIGNSIAWAQELEDGGTLETSLSYSAKAFYIWKRLNPSAKISGIYSFNDEKSGLGSALRGIRDEDLYGIASINLNTSVNISVIPWEGVGEALCQPFFDMGIVFKEEAFNPERDFKYSAGADFILYLDILKSLVARGSIGIDLTNPDWSDTRKYEITIESSLAY